MNEHTRRKTSLFFRIFVCHHVQHVVKIFEYLQCWRNKQAWRVLMPIDRASEKCHVLHAGCIFEKHYNLWHKRSITALSTRENDEMNQMLGKISRSKLSFSLFDFSSEKSFQQYFMPFQKLHRQLRLFFSCIWCLKFGKVAGKFNK